MQLPGIALRTRPAKQTRQLSLRRGEAIAGILMASPWIIGFLVFVAGPMIASLYLSMTRWDLFTAPQWVGFENYVNLLTNDATFIQSLKVTLIYSVVSVPLQVIVGLILATLLNQKIRFLGVFRSIYYLPSVVGGLSVAIMFRWIFGTQFGLLNGVLRIFGITGPSWLGDPNWVMISFILMSLWGSGSAMLIYLGGLQGIPTELYEAADVDGAGTVSKFLHITVPMMTPVIFFNLVMGIIAALQEFVLPFAMTNGGPANASLFIVLGLYRNAFQFFQMGYASAIAWILFIIILVLTIIIFRFSNAWVYYEGSIRGR
jgi:multiple sugar transport system permease protein